MKSAKIAWNLTINKKKSDSVQAKCEQEESAPELLLTSWQCEDVELLPLSSSHGPKRQNKNKKKQTCACM